MDFVPANEHEEAGLALIQDDRFHYRFTVSLENGARTLTVSVCQKHEYTVLGKAILPAHGRIYLSVTASEEGYDFYYGMDDQELIPVFTGADPTILSSLVNEGFTGAYLGMYASSNKTASDNYADFDWFLYEGQDW